MQSYKNQLHSTKNRVNSSRLKRVLEEGLHHDHTTDSEYHNSEIKQSLDIRKFLHKPKANVLKKKKTIPEAVKKHSANRN